MKSPASSRFYRAAEKEIFDGILNYSPGDWRTLRRAAQEMQQRHQGANRKNGSYTAFNQAAFEVAIAANFGSDLALINQIEGSFDNDNNRRARVAEASLAGRLIKPIIARLFLHRSTWPSDKKLSHEKVQEFELGIKSTVARINRERENFCLEAAHFSARLPSFSPYEPTQESMLAYLKARDCYLTPACVALIRIAFPDAKAG